MPTEIDAPLHAPLPTILHCPRCVKRHEDLGEWATRPHRRHQCAHCHFRWVVEPFCVGIPASPDTVLPVVFFAEKLVDIIRTQPSYEALISPKAGAIRTCTEALRQALLDHDRALLSMETSR